jgi:hypothetical protein
MRIRGQKNNVRPEFQAVTNSTGRNRTKRLRPNRPPRLLAYLDVPPTGVLWATRGLRCSDASSRASSSCGESSAHRYSPQRIPLRFLDSSRPFSKPSAFAGVKNDCTTWWAGWGCRGAEVGVRSAKTRFTRNRAATAGQRDSDGT